LDYCKAATAEAESCREISRDLQREAEKYREAINKLVEASERMMFLHMCEQEGITCGMPKPSDWLAAVDYLGQALEPFRKAGLDETKEQKQPSLNKSYTENKENASDKLNITDAFNNLPDPKNTVY
jgi:hypothetical protein